MPMRFFYSFPLLELLNSFFKILFFRLLAMNNFLFFFSSYNLIFLPKHFHEITHYSFLSSLIYFFFFLLHTLRHVTHVEKLLGNHWQLEYQSPNLSLISFFLTTELMSIILVGRICMRADFHNINSRIFMRWGGYYCYLNICL